MKVLRPLPYAGGYELHLYCDTMNVAHRHNEFPHRFFAETGADARRQSKVAGWQIHQDRTATCPKCRQKA